MSDLERVRGWFDSGLIVRPDASRLNFVDLTRAVLSLAGAEALGDTPGAKEIAGRIGCADHLVFILVDAMGLSILDASSPSGFFRSNTALTLQSVFPSTTAVALTSLATARFPAEHGIPGWWSWLDEYGVSATVLPFIERNSKKPLREFGVDPATVFTVPSAWSLVRRDALHLMPADYVDSIYSRYCRGTNRRQGYKTVPESLAAAKDHAGANQPTLTYVYLPQLDELAHHHGVGDARTLRCLLDIQSQVERLAAALAGSARIIVTADHGQIDVPRERVVVLPESDPLRAMLFAQPGGDPTVPMFHVLPGREREFAKEFSGRFGQLFALLTVDEVDALRLLGPGPLSPLTRRRLGAFVGISPRTAKLYIQPTGGSESHVGVHAALSADEMFTPLVLC